MDKLKDKHYVIRKDILDDLSSRFVINVPGEERENVIRICFQMELAYWFYLDFYCTQDESMNKSCTREFFYQMFLHIPSLKHLARNIDAILLDFRNYKMAVPTFGAILLSESLSHVLLVQSFFSKASWGFPKGKVNQDETPVHCALREVLEETGFDASHIIQEDLYLEHTYNDQMTRLYLVPGVPIGFKFIPQTRNEIKACQWFPIEELPNSRKEVRTVQVNGVTLGTNSFFMTMPFIKRIKRFVQEETKRRAQRRGKTRYKSLSEVETVSAVGRPGKPAPQPMRCLDLEEALMSTVNTGRYTTAPLDRNHSAAPPDPFPTPLLLKSSVKNSKSKQKLSIGKPTQQPTMGSPQKPTLVSPQKSTILEAPQNEEDTRFYPKEWREFKFDVDAILKCFS